MELGSAPTALWVGGDLACADTGVDVIYAR
jgi:hypothetical protein